MCTNKTYEMNIYSVLSMLLGVVRCFCKMSSSSTQLPEINNLAVASGSIDIFQPEVLVCGGSSG